MSLLRADLVFVTKNRQPMLTDTMLTFCEQTVHPACGALAAELVKFNGEADHTLIAHPPTHARTPLVPVLLRRVVRRRTFADHHRISATRRGHTERRAAPATDGMR